jgi:hypothetical protein
VQGAAEAAKAGGVVERGHGDTSVLAEIFHHEGAILHGPGDQLDGVGALGKARQMQDVLILV